MLNTTLAVGIPCYSDPWRHPSEEGTPRSEGTARGGIKGRVSEDLVIDHRCGYLRIEVVHKRCQEVVALGPRS